MNIKTRLLIATLAASAALSFSASAKTITVTNTNDSGSGSLRAAPASQTTEKAKMPLAQPQPSAALLLLPSLNRAREQAARFTPPEFCYVGKMKVACTLTDAPSKDPTGSRP